MYKLSIAQKRWLLSLHIVFSAIMLGETVVIVILSLTALTTKSGDVLRACYTILHVLSRTGVRYAPIFAVTTGIMLSAMTPWGLFRYYWIIVKEILTLLSLAIGMVGFYVWSVRGLSIVSTEGLVAWHNPVFLVNHKQLWIGIVLQLISLVAMFVISVFKPWGRRNSKENLLRRFDERSQL